MAVKYPILAYTDFTGSTAIELNTYQQDDFTVFLAQQEKKYVRMLLSDEAHAAFIAGTSEAKYITLVDGCSYTDSSAKQRYNEGLKEVLKYFIKAAWLQSQYRLTSIGREKNTNDNSTMASDAVNTSLIYEVYNNGIRLYYNDIERYVNEKLNETGFEGYEDFNMPVLDYLFL